MAQAVQAVYMPKRSENFRVKSVPIPSALPNSTQTDLPLANVMRTVSLTVSGLVSVDGGGADGVLRAEGMKNLISEIRIIATSKTGRPMGILKRLDLNAAYVLAGILNQSLPYYLAPTPITKGSSNSPFAIGVPIDFEMPDLKNPNDQRKTLLKGGELSSLSLELDWRTSADCFSAGTITLSSVAALVEAKQFVDPVSNAGKYRVNFTDYLEHLNAGANAHDSYDIGKKRYLRGILVESFTRTAVYHVPEETQINSLAVQTDSRQVKYYDSLYSIKAENQRNLGFAMPAGYYWIDFCSSGSLDTILDERPFGKVSLELSVNNLANGVVRVFPVEVSAN